MTSLSMSQIRNSVKEMYPHSASWHLRVDRMFDQQVYAIYKEHEEAEEKKEKANPKQLSLF
jgi:hypothetical protein